MLQRGDQGNDTLSAVVVALGYVYGNFAVFSFAVLPAAGLWLSMGWSAFWSFLNDGWSLDSGCLGRVKGVVASH